MSGLSPEQRAVAQESRTASASERARPGRAVGRRLLAWVLSACVAGVVIWEVGVIRSRRPYRPYTLSPAVFDDVTFVVPGWKVRRLPLENDPLEPNILILLLQSADRPQVSVMLRLVHGYNLVDCMRMKSYRVELVADTFAGPGSGPRPSSPAPGYPLQVWQLTSPRGERAVWISSMLRADTFEATALDTRSMQFPRLGVPDRPDSPQRLSWEAMRVHPVRELHSFFMAKWNRSGRDVRVFLGVKPDPLLSDQYFTFVAIQAGPAPGVSRAEMRAAVHDAHSRVYALLRELRASGRLPITREGP